MQSEGYTPDARSAHSTTPTRVARAEFIEAQVERLLRPVNAVEIDVAQSQPAGVFGGKDERGAVDVALDAEAAGETLREAGLACA